MYPRREKRELAGWFKMYRQLLDSEEWHTLTDGQCKVLVTLLALADWEIEPGIIRASTREIAELAKVGRQVVRATLHRLGPFGTGFLEPCHEDGTPTHLPNPPSQPTLTGVYRIVKFSEKQGLDDDTTRVPNPPSQPTVYIQEGSKNTTLEPLELTHPPADPPQPKPKAPRVSSGDIAAVRAAYGQEVERRLGFAPDYSQPDNAIVRRLILKHGADEARELVVAYVGLRDRWLAEKGYPLRLLQANINAVQAARAAGGSRPGECKASPAPAFDLDAWKRDAEEHNREIVANAARAQKLMEEGKL